MKFARKVSTIPWANVANANCNALWLVSYLSLLLVRMQPSMISFSSGTLTLAKLSGLIPWETNRQSNVWTETGSGRRSGGGVLRLWLCGRSGRRSDTRSMDTRTSPSPGCTCRRRRRPRPRCTSPRTSLEPWTLGSLNASWVNNVVI